MTEQERERTVATVERVHAAFRKLLVRALETQDISPATIDTVLDVERNRWVTTITAIRAQVDARPEMAVGIRTSRMRS